MMEIYSIDFNYGCDPFRIRLDITRNTPNA
ncbi:hypothetical protein DES49_2229 [Halospina denitrificans]|uniref:Uncharacterized protein n=1 Tax=Halospina denitrificans TaxID=332522 RepID=A0A4R7JMJ3_9GAMM|nr:hypothetical protein DES49_2229 [Halospina denitrificans]